MKIMNSDDTYIVTMKVIIMSGISGAGKTTYAEKLVRECAKHGERSALYSADDYFMLNGEYKFDPAKLGAAHADCFARFITCLYNCKADTVIVDNTNTTAIEIAPYVLGADAFGYKHEIVMLKPACFWKTGVGYLNECVERNIHGVSYDTIGLQWKRLQAMTLPPSWNVRYIQES